MGLQMPLKKKSKSTSSRRVSPAHGVLILTSIEKLASMDTGSSESFRLARTVLVLTILLFQVSNFTAASLREDGLEYFTFFLYAFSF